MQKRRFGRNAALALVACTALAGAARGELPGDVAVGARAEVEGRRVGSGLVMAGEVEVKRAKSGDDEAEGAIEEIDPGARSLRVGGVRVALAPGAPVSSDEGRALELGQLKPGQKGSAEGTFADGVLRARSLEVEEMKADEAEDVELEGTITDADRAQGSFRLLGVTVKVTPQTQVELD